MIYQFETLHRNSTSSPDAAASASSFQPLDESVRADNDGSGVDYPTQTKHRRLSKVPYTSLDVPEPEDDDAGAGSDSQALVPEEEIVTPLLNDRDEPTGVGDEPALPEPPTAEVLAAAVADYDPAAYDPAIYDPAGTGYDYNSQEYYNYYYGSLQQQGETASHLGGGDYGSAAQPQYEYNTTYPSDENGSAGQTNWAPGHDG